MAIFCAARTTADDELTPDVLLLARIKHRISENLVRLPNYTCTQTIERSRRRSPTRKFEPIDTVRLEVALVEGKELFAWPGSGRFEDAEITDLIKGEGAIGNGSFALHARSVFLSGAASFTYVGERFRDDLRTVRYDYRVPQFRSGYTVRIGLQKGIVGYHGSFWVDAKTLDLLRLEVHADEIPPHVPLASTMTAMEYRRVRIGESDFLLPVEAELILVDLHGNESRNRTVFAGCRKYTGESVLTFDDPPPDTPDTQNAVTEFELPIDLELELALSDTITPDQAVGDAITARVRRHVKRKGIVVVPKGALVSGRISRMEHRNQPVPHFLVAIEFSTLEFEGYRAHMDGAVLEVTKPPINIGSRQLQMIYSKLPGGVFVIPGSRFRLGRGTPFLWRSTAKSNEESK